MTEFKAPVFETGEVGSKQKQPESENNTFVPNEEGMTTLLSMGFPEPRCLKGLYHTGNSNAEDAMNWIFAHMDDADIDDPFNPNDSHASTNDSGPSQDLVDNVAAMGFSTQLAKKSIGIEQ